MPIMVNCSCGNVMSIEDQFAGKTVVCNQCQRVTAVPAVGPMAPAQAPAGTAPNPYLAQNAGYAAAANPQGYAAAPSPYYTPQQVGARRPGRGLLITGGVLAIIAALLWVGIIGAALAIGSSEEGGFGELSDRGQTMFVVFVGLAIAAAFSIVSASFAFAAKVWAAVITPIIHLALMGFCFWPISEDPKRLAPAFGFFAAMSGLAAIFGFIGIKQAKAIQAWKGQS